MRIPFGSRKRRKPAVGLTNAMPLRRYDNFSRGLLAEEEAILCNKWALLLGASPLPASQVRYMANRIVEIERMCAGRLAGDLRDAVLRTLVASRIAGSGLRVLEIGTLFGINAAILYDIGISIFDRVEMLIVDPLDGYYGRDQLDPTTGLRITDQTVRRNLQIVAVPPTNIEIVTERSDSSVAIQKARDRTFNLMFIDGDHSYEGVKSDFELYGTQLETQGFLIFDNYRDGTCPGVDRFVDELSGTAGPYRCVGSVWRSAVFQRN